MKEQAVKAPTPKGKEFVELLRQADKPHAKPEALEELRSHLAQHPLDAAQMGDLVRILQYNLTTTTFANNKGIGVTVGAHCRNLRSDLGHAEASPLERMLIENIVVCWLRLYTVELTYDTAGGHSLAQGAHWERRLTLSHHRYLKAIETLARFRKLGVNVQINVGNQQVITR